jgi:hypothetical protein
LSSTTAAFYNHDAENVAQGYYEIRPRSPTMPGPVPFFKLFQGCPQLLEKAHQTAVFQSRPLPLLSSTAVAVIVTVSRQDCTMANNNPLD